MYRRSPKVLEIRSDFLPFMWPDLYFRPRIRTKTSKDRPVDSVLRTGLVSWEWTFFWLLKKVPMVCRNYFPKFFRTVPLHVTMWHLRVRSCFIITPTGTTIRIFSVILCSTFRGRHKTGPKFKNKVMKDRQTETLSMTNFKIEGMYILSLL